jgi:hypothetical protein
MFSSSQMITLTLPSRASQIILSVLSTSKIITLNVIIHSYDYS